MPSILNLDAVLRADARVPMNPSANDLYRMEPRVAIRTRGKIIFGRRDSPFSPFVGFPRHTYDPDDEYGSRVTSMVPSRAPLLPRARHFCIIRAKAQKRSDLAGFRIITTHNKVAAREVSKE